MKRPKNYSRFFLLLICLFSLTSTLGISTITSRFPVAHAATPSSATSFDLTDTWQGQGTYYSGGASFDMLLTITAMSGSTFSGRLAEDTYNSAVAVSGSVTSVSSGNATITFTDPSTLWGGQIVLNATYSGTVSNGQMSGVWYYSGDSSPDGALSLNVTFAPTLTTDCGHLVTPWAALYQYPNFGGQQLCFEGTGLIDLSQFGLNGQIASINIAASGTFFSQQNGKGNQLAFYFGEEKADLGTWDNQISSFIIYGANSPPPTIKPGGLWVYPGNGFTFSKGNKYTITVLAYQTLPTDPVIDHVNITGYWNNTWHTICRVPNNQPALGDYYYCSTNFLLNGQYPPAGTIKLSFDVYDVAGNKNLAPNGVHTGMFSTTKAPVTYYPTPSSPPDPNGQIDPVVQTYIGCVTDVFFEKYVKIAGLSHRLFKLLDDVYQAYSKGETVYSVYKDINTGQLVAIPGELAKAVVPGASCYQVIIETTTARPAS